VSDIESTVRTIESLCSEDAAWSSSDRAFVKHETRTLVATLTTDRDEWKRRYVDMAGTRAEEWKQYVAAEKERETLRTRAEAAEKERDELRQDLNDARDGWERAVEEVRRLDAIEGAAKAVRDDIEQSLADRSAKGMQVNSIGELDQCPPSALRYIDRILRTALSDSLSDTVKDSALGSGGATWNAALDVVRDVGEDPDAVIDRAVANMNRWRPGPDCTCINGNDHAAATTAVVDCPACGEGE
jgi:flagellar biosynthesis GTPase FlhF